MIYRRIQAILNSFKCFSVDRIEDESRFQYLLDRAFRQSPLVVLRNFGGLGKAALAAEAGRWFTRTGRFPSGAAFISF
ncbi:MAG: hypothetical protein M5U34_36510 [Chloroflexi bacterium]|nr:hypothetical protein [Chloroflexota bacterium]